MPAWWRFGAPVSLGQTINFAIRRWDNLVVSSLHGPAAVGAYNLAYNLADIPAVQIGEQVTEALQVGFTKDRAADPRVSRCGRCRCWRSS